MLFLSLCVQLPIVSPIAVSSETAFTRWEFEMLQTRTNIAATKKDLCVVWVTENMNSFYTIHDQYLYFVDASIRYKQPIPRFQLTPKQRIVDKTAITKNECLCDNFLLIGDPSIGSWKEAVPFLEYPVCANATKGSWVVATTTKGAITSGLQELVEVS